MITSRRNFLAGAVGLLVAPSIVRASAIMPVHTIRRSPIHVIVTSNMIIGADGPKPLKHLSELPVLLAGDYLTVMGSVFVGGHLSIPEGVKATLMHCHFISDEYPSRPIVEVTGSPIRFG